MTDIDHTNILDLVGDADLILDGTDNFETRFLVNDAAVKLGKPWIFGGVLGSEGQTMTCFLSSSCSLLRRRVFAV